MYRKGYSLLFIAKKLSDEGVAPPRAKAKGHRARFWRKSTLREMLGDRSYIGEWTYGKKRWRRDPEARKRRYSMQAPDEIIERLRPHLRIIPHSLWCTVQERRRAVYENYSGKSNGAPGRRTSHPFSGLLFCGVCGNRMVDGGGTSARYYKCSGAMTGGICANKAPVREDGGAQAAALVPALRQAFHRAGPGHPKGLPPYRALWPRGPPSRASEASAPRRGGARGGRRSSPLVESVARAGFEPTTFGL